MSGTLLSFRDVSRSYPGGVTALEGLSFDVAPGEFLSLLGPSGCGKTTALRLIAGLERPDAGRILWADRSNRDPLGMVFQSPTLMPWSDVWSNVWLPLRLAGQSRSQARRAVEEALSLVGLSDFGSAFPRELSGGMAMRVSLARALVTRPSMILLDEPFAALDEITRFRLNDDLLRLRDATGATIVFVTHSVFESVFLSDRIAVMTSRPGRIAETLRIDAANRDAAFRTSAEFAAHARRVSMALGAAMEPA
jgi:NitT/TauT family transport system ATP-binding protein